MIEDTVMEDPPTIVLPTVDTVTPAIDEREAFAAVADKIFSENPKDDDTDLSPLSDKLMREFDQAAMDRRDTEQRWLLDLRQYKGKYDPTVEADLKGRSKAFVRKTRVKVKTVDSRVADLLFPAGSEKNWTVENTPVPSISDETRAEIEQQMAQGAQGQPIDKKMVDKAIVDMAREAAKGMTKVIEDQLVEARYKESSLKAIHSGHLYGTGILKGPLVERKVRTRFVQKGKKWVAQNETYTVPFVEAVPLWRFYPDMAATELSQCRFVFERHHMTKASLLALADRRSFKKQAIKDFVAAHPDGEIINREHDNELKEMGERVSKQTTQDGQYELLERWGWIDGGELESVGVKIPEDRKHESFFSNIWMLPNGTVIKAVLQPINGVTWPYHLYYFDKDETSIFGEGLSSIMRDDQDMLNAATRMMLDNGALTSGPMVEVFLDLLATTEHAEVITPWKVILRNGKHPEHPAYRPVQMNNNLEWLTQMAERFDSNADEVTAIPRYMAGENVSNGAAGTASGMSMLMGAANIVIKDLISAWDEGVTRNFLQALYRWNMQFHKDNEIKGDFDVKARGTASLVAKEVRARQLTEFGQIAANPLDAPFIKRHKLLLAQAEALEMSDVVKTEDEVMAEQNSEQGKKMAQMQQQLQEAQLAQELAKAQKLSAEAQVAKTKVDEMLANIDLIVASAVSKKVETIFAALQAGGVATRDPVTAPAGDEILRSAGYRDITPDPSIAQLAGPPVQGQQQTVRVASKGETFAQDPRMAGAVDPATQVDPGPGPVSGAVEMPDANTGQRAGIETTRIEA